MKVALVGCAPTWKAVPFDDESWEIWAHGSCQPLGLPRVTRWFDLHQPEVWRQPKPWFKATETALTYMAWLGQLTTPMVMQQQYPLVPASEAYPLREIVEQFGIIKPTLQAEPYSDRWWGFIRQRGEFACTAAFMLALALAEGADDVMLCGIDFSGNDVLAIERPWQRASMKYWVGIARGLGIPVTIANGSYFEWAPWIYGYERHEVTAAVTPEAPEAVGV